jgi:hypothetical protein
MVRLKCEIIQSAGFSGSAAGACVLCVRTEEQAPARQEALVAGASTAGYYVAAVTARRHPVLGRIDPNCYE